MLKAQLEKSHLVEKLSLVKYVLDKKDELTKYIWIESNNRNKVDLKILGMDITFSTEVFCSSIEGVQEKDEIIGVNAKKFLELISKLLPGELILENKDEGFFVKQKRKKYKLPKASPSYGLVTPNFQGNFFSLFPEQVKSLLSYTAPSLDQESQFSECLYLGASGEQVEACATATNSMTHYRFHSPEFLELFESLGDKKYFCIHKKYIKSLRQILSYYAKECSSLTMALAVTPKQAIFRFNMQDFFAVPLDSNKFPSVKEVLDSLNNNKENQVGLNKKDLESALYRLEVLSLDRWEEIGPVKFEFTPDGAELFYSSTDGSQAIEFVESNGVVQDTLYLNLQDIDRYLATFSESDQIFLNQVEGTKPVSLIGDENVEFDSEALAVLMPVVPE